MDFILPVIAGTLTYLILGYLDFEFILGKYMKANTTKIKGFMKSDKEFSFLFLIVSCLAYAALLVLVLTNWSEKDLNFLDASLISACLGALVAVMTNSYWYASSHYFNSLKPLVVDAIAAAVTVGITGGVISLLLT